MFVVIDAPSQPTRFAREGERIRPHGALVLRREPRRFSDLQPCPISRARRSEKSKIGLHLFCD
jgi:hypothetical protein